MRLLFLVVDLVVFRMIIGCLGGPGGFPCDECVLCVDVVVVRAMIGVWMDLVVFRMSIACFVVLVASSCEYWLLGGSGGCPCVCYVFCCC